MDGLDRIVCRDAYSPPSWSYWERRCPSTTIAWPFWRTTSVGDQRPSGTTAPKISLGKGVLDRVSNVSDGTSIRLECRPSGRGRSTRPMGRRDCAWCRWGNIPFAWHASSPIRSLVCMAFSVRRSCVDRHLRSALALRGCLIPRSMPATESFDTSSRSSIARPNSITSPLSKRVFPAQPLNGQPNYSRTHARLWVSNLSNGSAAIAWKALHGRQPLNLSQAWLHLLRTAETGASCTPCSQAQPTGRHILC